MLEANVGLDTARGNTGRGNLGRGQDLLGQCPEVRAQRAVVRRQFKQAPSFRTYRFHQPVRHPVPPAVGNQYLPRPHAPPCAGLPRRARGPSPSRKCSPCCKSRSRTREFPPRPDSAICVETLQSATVHEFVEAQPCKKNTPRITSGG